MVHPGVVAVFAFLSLGACIAPLVPSLFWGETDLGKLSLWRMCVDGHCENIHFDKSDFDTEAGAERDAAVAGLILACFFLLLALVTAACRSRCGLILTTVLALLFSAVTVGCMARLSTANDITLTYGFYVSCVATGLILITSIISCAVPKRTTSNYTAFV